MSCNLMCYVSSVVLKFCKTCNFIKKRNWHRCFPVNFAKFLRTPFFTEHLWTTASIIRTVKCEILANKKTSGRTLQIALYLVFLKCPLNTYKKKKNEKRFDCKRKRTFFYLNFSSIATLKNI